MQLMYCLYWALCWPWGGPCVGHVPYHHLSADRWEEAYIRCSVSLANGLLGIATSHQTGGMRGLTEGRKQQQRQQQPHDCKNLHPAEERNGLDHLAIRWKVPCLPPPLSAALISPHPVGLDKSARAQRCRGSARHHWMGARGGGGEASCA